MPKGKGYFGGEPVVKKSTTSAGMVAATNTRQKSSGKTTYKGKNKSMKRSGRYK